MRQGVGSTRVRRARRAVAPVGFVVILVAGLVGLVGPAGARPGTGGPRTVEVTTNHALISACSFDGVGTPCSPVVKERSDFSAFIESVSDSDDLNDGRSANANASQNTTVDSSDPLVTRVSSVGVVGASWTDGAAGDGADPSVRSASEFTVTFEVTDATPFSLSGELTATGDAVSVECTTVTVTSPTGAVFQVATPSSCGAPPGLSIQEGGKLEPGTYTFSVVANAQALNPDALGGTAAAGFNVDLGLGCTIIGTENADTLAGTAEDDLICGLGGDDTIDGLGGGDSIEGGSGSDVITGGEGGDGIFGGSGSDTITGGEGSDFIFGDDGLDTIEGGTGNDGINGGGDDDVIIGDDAADCDGAFSDPGLDDDLILGGGGNDLIFGCQGLDTILGQGGDDRIDGNSGHDNLEGGRGSDKIHGNGGPDTLTGGARKDVLFGDGANDTLFALDGVFDVVHGGPGGGDEAQVDLEDQVDGVEGFF